MLLKNVFRVSGIANIVLAVSIMATCAIAGTDKLVVAVSYAPYARIVNAVGGEMVEVVTMLPPGTDLSTYVPKPEELMEFSRADVYFTDGSGADTAWLPRFKQLKKSIDVVDVSDNVVWNHPQSGVRDPNIWISPKQMAKIASNVSKALTKYMPEKNEYFVVKLSIILQQMNRVDDNLKRSVLMLPENLRVAIVPRPLYGYLAQDYKLKQVSVNISGNAPTPKELDRLIEEGRKNNARLVFVTPQFSQESIQKIKKELNAKVVVLDDLSYNFLENVKNIHAAVKEIVDERLKEALADPTKNPKLKKK
ncbi:MAG: zinc ABC transporter substrate-binding protein [Fibrobacter sp.]|jgi:ABC-type metal ion transport system, periplasmic component/surface adhesin|nr:zinc ABC transporter substrate-binding protein [Fibrobacter sp.]